MGAPIERWKNVKGFRGRYEVSSMGRIRSCLEKSVLKDPERVMKQQTHWKGYKIIFLRTKGVKRKYFVHRLVGEAFLSNKAGLPIVNHKDGVRHNNVLENLEWVSHWGNSVDKLQRARRVAALAKLPDTPEQIAKEVDMLEHALSNF